MQTKHPKLCPDPTGGKTSELYRYLKSFDNGKDVNIIKNPLDDLDYEYDFIEEYLSQSDILELNVFIKKIKSRYCGDNPIRIYYKDKLHYSIFVATIDPKVYEGYAIIIYDCTKSRDNVLWLFWDDPNYDEFFIELLNPKHFGKNIMNEN